jgi:hypothetical protein
MHNTNTCKHRHMTLLRGDLNNHLHLVSVRESMFQAPAPDHPMALVGVWCLAPEASLQQHFAGEFLIGGDNLLIYMLI